MRVCSLGLGEVFRVYYFGLTAVEDCAGRLLRLLSLS